MRDIIMIVFFFISFFVGVWAGYQACQGDWRAIAVKYGIAQWIPDKDIPSRNNFKLKELAKL